ncbi:adenosine kinase [Candidatus Woesearchaeota archaeon]|nr:adenosine kinase [Candidatus Woesearchaeota archaeon]
MKKYDVIGIGNVLLDFIVEVEDGILAEMDVEKGRFKLIEEEKSKEILKKLEKYEVKTAPGGSAANTLAGVSVFGGSAMLLGKIGNDKHGDIYEQKTNECGVNVRLSRHDSKITGHCITFITPDAERSFATHLGASLHFRKEDVFEEEIKASKILHVEGYQLEDPELRAATVYAMKVAKENNVKVSIDLSDPGLVDRNLKDLEMIVKEYADIVFVNEMEAEAFTGKKNEEALHAIYDMCEIAVVKLGKEGSLIKANDMIYRIPIYESKVVNTNGAGDMYAAGVLYGIANGWDMEKAGKVGSYAAGKVVSQVGARLKKGDVDIENV